ncbi:MAG: ABC transporter permease [Actinomycetota bacterium]
MNWLTWRQYRKQAVAGYGGLAVIGAFLAITGIAILQAYNDSGLVRCLNISNPDCGELTRNFTHQYNSLQFFLLFVMLLPVLVGMFWGAPMVARELEHGTHRLAWTQSVTRGRWIWSKLAIVGGSVLLFSSILAALINWWITPFLKTSWGRFDPGLFDMLGIVPVAYSLFAFALGVAFGTLTRKTLPAIFLTLAGFAAVRIPIAAFARKHFMAAKEIVFGFNADGPVHVRGDWILSMQTIDASGRQIGEFGGLDFNTITTRCPDLIGSFGEPTKSAFFECANRIGVRSIETYHPADRFWTFQMIEAAIFLALTGLLVAFIVRRVKRLS